MISEATEDEQMFIVLLFEVCHNPKVRKKESVVMSVGRRRQFCDCTFEYVEWIDTPERVALTFTSLCV